MRAASSAAQIAQQDDTDSLDTDVETDSAITRRNNHDILHSIDSRALIVTVIFCRMSGRKARVEQNVLCGG